MNVAAENLRVQKRYCPVVKENVMVNVREDYENKSIDIKCHNVDNCVVCFGRCRNKYIGTSVL